MSFISLAFLVDGNWTSWTSWGSCSRSCGLGYERRIRFCTNPRPERGGNDCPGDWQEFRPCNDFICPGNTNKAFR